VIVAFSVENSERHEEENVEQDEGYHCERDINPDAHP
jgi:hypothetical protein